MLDQGNRHKANNKSRNPNFFGIQLLQSPRCSTLDYVQGTRDTAQSDTSFSVISKETGASFDVVSRIVADGPLAA